MVARPERRGDLVTSSEGAEGEPIGYAFGCDHDIRFNAIVLYAEHFACPAKPCLHFVSDEEDAVAIQDTFHGLEVVGRRDDDTALPEYRLGDESCHVTRSMVAYN